ncbi:MAG: hypothetical protein RLZZ502_666 [Pseudomonadota bacterium]
MVEFKKSLAELSNGLASLCAMLNKHESAEMWLGVSNNGRVSGQEVSESTLREVSQKIAAHIEPRIYPEVSKVVIGTKACIRVLARGQEKPYYASGRAYLRVADEDRVMSARELENFILSQHRNEHLGLSISGTKYQLNALKRQAVIAHTGPTKGGQWKILST